MKPEDFGIDEQMLAEADRAWSQNRAAILEWLESQEELVSSVMGGHATAASTNAIMNVCFVVGMQDPEVLAKMPVMLASMVTLMLHGSQNEVADDELPPMITTEDVQYGKFEDTVTTSDSETEE